MIGIGAACTLIGGAGVTFRAAGIGYLAQSLGGLVLGLALLAGGLTIAARPQRRSRAAVTHPQLVIVRHTVVHEWAPQPAAERIRVPAWVDHQKSLPAGRAA